MKNKAPGLDANKALSLASCFISISATHLVLYFSYSTHGNALTYISIIFQKARFFNCIKFKNKEKVLLKKIMEPEENTGVNQQGSVKTLLTLSTGN